ncbi:hypothetical protein MRX96_004727 [Rhipicephalus microplus]
MAAAERKRRSTGWSVVKVSDLNSSGTKTLVSGSVPSRLWLEHIEPESLCLVLTSSETANPGDEAFPPSKQLIQAAEPPWRADFGVPVAEREPQEQDAGGRVPAVNLQSLTRWA